MDQPKDHESREKDDENKNPTLLMAQPSIKLKVYKNFITVTNTGVLLI